MDGAHQRRRHRLGRLSALLTAFVAPPPPILDRVRSKVFRRAADDRPIPRPNRGAGRDAFDNRAPVLPSRLEAPARGAIPGTDRAHESTAHEFQL